MDDLVTLAALVSSAFFVAVTFGLLFRYRQASQRIQASTDLGHDLWGALEQRLKKQDERILDLMGRFEVIQSRAIEAPRASTLVRPSVQRSVSDAQSQSSDIEEPTVTFQPGPKPHVRITLDKIERNVMNFLGKGAKSTIEVKDSIGKSREHTARVMKSLFDRGLVTRDDSEKPFVYSLSEEGRKSLG